MSHPLRQGINEYGALRHVSHSLLPSPLPISLVVGFGRVRHLQQRSQWFGLDKQRIKREHRLMTPGWSFIQPSQRFIQSRMVQQDVLHPTLDSGRIERLRAHQRVRIQRAHDGIEC